MISCNETSVTRLMSVLSFSANVSATVTLSNDSGARTLYHFFAFHLSFTFRAAVLDRAFAIVITLLINHLYMIG